MNLNLTVLLQRTMELLAYYLILSNMNGKGLKESFRDLFTTNQRILYENIALFVGYILAMTFVIQDSRDFGHWLVYVIQPFIGLLLIKKADIKQAFLGGIGLLLMPIVPLLLNRLPFLHFHTLINFSLMLTLVFFFVHMNYYHKVYVYLTHEKFWLNLSGFISFLIYMLPLFFQSEQMVTFLPTLLYLLFAFLARKRIEKKWEKAIELISNGAFDDIVLLLKKLSDDYTEIELDKHFTLVNNNKRLSVKFVETLSTELEKCQASKVIRSYNCQFIKEQLKISIFL